MRRAVLAVASTLLLAGCSSSGVIVDGSSPVASPYSGPMVLPVDHDANATVLARSGAAGQALQCDTEPYSGGGGEYDTGLASVQDSAAHALENYFDAEGVGAPVPTKGYRVERDGGGPVLLSYDVNGRTKVAFVVADSVRDYQDHEGWGIEAWAACDPAELPASVTDKLGIGVWQDRAERRVPVARIQSYQGAAYCDWQDITFVQLGAEARQQYVRDTTGELRDALRTTYSAHTILPERAADTGFHRGGRELWLSADQDAAYLVSLDDPSYVERWPAAKRGIGCA